tara:strand:- start:3152 stop:3400 length:249 start_codon:yes stop_codon:yes gene_type:complete
MSSQFVHDMTGKLANIEKVSEIQEMLQNMATLMVAYPDASEDQSKQWQDTLNMCRVELRRRHRLSAVRLAPNKGTFSAQNKE